MGKSSKVNTSNKGGGGEKGAGGGGEGDFSLTQGMGLYIKLVWKFTKHFAKAIYTTIQPFIATIGAPILSIVMLLIIIDSVLKEIANMFYETAHSGKVGWLVAAIFEALAYSVKVVLDGVAVTVTATVELTLTIFNAMVGLISAMSAGLQTAINAGINAVKEGVSSSNEIAQVANIYKGSLASRPSEPMPIKITYTEDQMFETDRKNTLKLYEDYADMLEFALYNFDLDWKDALAVGLVRKQQLEMQEKLEMQMDEKGHPSNDPTLGLQNVELLEGKIKNVYYAAYRAAKTSLESKQKKGETEQDALKRIQEAKDNLYSVYMNPQELRKAIEDDKKLKEENDGMDLNTNKAKYIVDMFYNINDYQKKLSDQITELLQAQADFIEDTFSRFVGGKDGFANETIDEALNLMIQKKYGGYGYPKQYYTGESEDNEFILGAKVYTYETTSVLAPEDLKLERISNEPNPETGEITSCLWFRSRGGAREYKVMGLEELSQFFTTKAKRDYKEFQDISISKEKTIQEYTGDKQVELFEGTSKLYDEEFILIPEGGAIGYFGKNVMTAKEREEVQQKYGTRQYRTEEEEALVVKSIYGDKYASIFVELNENRSNRQLQIAADFIIPVQNRNMYRYATTKKETPKNRARLYGGAIKATEDCTIAEIGTKTDEAGTLSECSITLKDSAQTTTYDTKNNNIVTYSDIVKEKLDSIDPYWNSKYFEMSDEPDFYNEDIAVKLNYNSSEGAPLSGTYKIIDKKNDLVQTYKITFYDYKKKKMTTYIQAKKTSDLTEEDGKENVVIKNENLWKEYLNFWNSDEVQLLFDNKDNIRKILNYDLRKAIEIKYDTSKTVEEKEEELNELKLGKIGENKYANIDTIKGVLGTKDKYTDINEYIDSNYGLFNDICYSSDLKVEIKRSIDKAIFKLSPNVTDEELANQIHQIKLSEAGKIKSDQIKNILEYTDNLRHKLKNEIEKEDLFTSVNDFLEFYFSNLDDDGRNCLLNGDEDDENTEYTPFPIILEPINKYDLSYEALKASTIEKLLAQNSIKESFVEEIEKKCIDNKELNEKDIKTCSLNELIQKNIITESDIENSLYKRATFQNDIKPKVKDVSDKNKAIMYSMPTSEIGKGEYDGKEYNANEVYYAMSRMNMLKMLFNMTKDERFALKLEDGNTSYIENSIISGVVSEIKKLDGKSVVSLLNLGTNAVEKYVEKDWAKDTDLSKKGDLQGEIVECKVDGIIYGLTDKAKYLLDEGHWKDYKIPPEGTIATAVVDTVNSDGTGIVKMLKEIKNGTKNYYDVLAAGRDKNGLLKLKIKNLETSEIEEYPSLISFGEKVKKNLDDKFVQKEIKKETDTDAQKFGRKYIYNYMPWNKDLYTAGEYSTLNGIRSSNLDDKINPSEKPDLLFKFGKTIPKDSAVAFKGRTFETGINGTYFSDLGDTNNLIVAPEDCILTRAGWDGENKDGWTLELMSLDYERQYRFSNLGNFSSWIRGNLSIKAENWEKTNTLIDIDNYIIIKKGEVIAQMGASGGPEVNNVPLVAPETLRITKIGYVKEKQKDLVTNKDVEVTKYNICLENAQGTKQYTIEDVSGFGEAHLTKNGEINSEEKVPLQSVGEKVEYNKCKLANYITDKKETLTTELYKAVAKSNTPGKEEVEYYKIRPLYIFEGETIAYAKVELETASGGELAGQVKHKLVTKIKAETIQSNYLTTDNKTRSGVNIVNQTGYFKLYRNPPKMEELFQPVHVDFIASKLDNIIPSNFNKKVTSKNGEIMSVEKIIKPHDEGTGKLNNRELEITYKPGSHKVTQIECYNRFGKIIGINELIYNEKEENKIQKINYYEVNAIEKNKEDIELAKNLKRNGKLVNLYHTEDYTQNDSGIALDNKNGTTHKIWCRDINEVAKVALCNSINQEFKFNIIEIKNVSITESNAGRIKDVTVEVMAPDDMTINKLVFYDKDKNKLHEGSIYSNNDVTETESNCRKYKVQITKKGTIDQIMAYATDDIVAYWKPEITFATKTRDNQNLKMNFYEGLNQLESIRYFNDDGEEITKDIMAKEQNTEAMSIMSYIADENAQSDNVIKNSKADGYKKYTNDTKIEDKENKLSKIRLEDKNGNYTEYIFLKIINVEKIKDTVIKVDVLVDPSDGVSKIEYYGKVNGTEKMIYSRSIQNANKNDGTYETDLKALSKTISKVIVYTKNGATSESNIETGTKILGAKKDKEKNSMEVYLRKGTVNLTKIECFDKDNKTIGSVITIPENYKFEINSNGAYVYTINAKNLGLETFKLDTVYKIKITDSSNKTDEYDMLKIIQVDKVNNNSNKINVKIVMDDKDELVALKCYNSSREEIKDKSKQMTNIERYSKNIEITVDGDHMLEKDKVRKIEIEDKNGEVVICENLRPIITKFESKGDNKVNIEWENGYNKTKKIILYSGSAAGGYTEVGSIEDPKTTSQEITCSVDPKSITKAIIIDEKGIEVGFKLLEITKIVPRIDEEGNNYIDVTVESVNPEISVRVRKRDLANPKAIRGAGITRRVTSSTFSFEYDINDPIISITAQSGSSECVYNGPKISDVVVYDTEISSDTITEENKDTEGKEITCKRKIKLNYNIQQSDVSTAVVYDPNNKEVTRYNAIGTKEEFDANSQSYTLKHESELVESNGDVKITDKLKSKYVVIYDEFGIGDRKYITDETLSNSVLEMGNVTTTVAPGVKANIDVKYQLYDIRGRIGMYTNTNKQYDDDKKIDGKCLDEKEITRSTGTDSGKKVRIYDDVALKHFLIDQEWNGHVSLHHWGILWKTKELATAIDNSIDTMGGKKIFADKDIKNGKGDWTNMRDENRKIYEELYENTHINDIFNSKYGALFSIKFKSKDMEKEIPLDKENVTKIAENNAKIPENNQEDKTCKLINIKNGKAINYTIDNVTLWLNSNEKIEKKYNDNTITGEEIALDNIGDLKIDNAKNIGVYNISNEIKNKWHVEEQLISGQTGDPWQETDFIANVWTSWKTWSNRAGRAATFKAYYKPISATKRLTGYGLTPEQFNKIEKIQMTASYKHNPNVKKVITLQSLKIRDITCAPNRDITVNLVSAEIPGIESAQKYGTYSTGGGDIIGNTVTFKGNADDIPKNIIRTVNKISIKGKDGKEIQIHGPKVKALLNKKSNILQVKVTQENEENFHANGMNQNIELYEGGNKTPKIELIYKNKGVYSIIHDVSNEEKNGIKIINLHRYQKQLTSSNLKMVRAINENGLGSSRTLEILPNIGGVSLANGTYKISINDIKDTSNEYIKAVEWQNLKGERYQYDFEEKKFYKYNGIAKEEKTKEEISKDGYIFTDNTTKELQIQLSDNNAIETNLSQIKLYCKDLLGNIICCSEVKGPTINGAEMIPDKKEINITVSDVNWKDANKYAEHIWLNESDKEHKLSELIENKDVTASYKDGIITISKGEENIALDDITKIISVKVNDDRGFLALSDVTGMLSIKNVTPTEDGKLEIAVRHVQDIISIEAIKGDNGTTEYEVLKLDENNKLMVDNGSGTVYEVTQDKDSTDVYYVSSENNTVSHIIVTDVKGRKVEVEGPIVVPQKTDIDEETVQLSLTVTQPSYEGSVVKDIEFYDINNKKIDVKKIEKVKYINEKGKQEEEKRVKIKDLIEYINDINSRTQDNKAVIMEINRTSLLNGCRKIKVINKNGLVKEQKIIDSTRDANTLQVDTVNIQKIGERSVYKICTQETGQYKHELKDIKAINIEGTDIQVKHVNKEGIIVENLAKYNDNGEYFYIDLDTKIDRIQLISKRISGTNEDKNEESSWYDLTKIVDVKNNNGTLELYILGENGQGIDSEKTEALMNDGTKVTITDDNYSITEEGDIAVWKIKESKNIKSIKIVDRTGTEVLTVQPPNIDAEIANTDTGTQFKIKVTQNIDATNPQEIIGNEIKSIELYKGDKLLKTPETLTSHYGKQNIENEGESVVIPIEKFDDLYNADKIKIINTNGLTSTNDIYKFVINEIKKDTKDNKEVLKVDVSGILEEVKVLYTSDTEAKTLKANELTKDDKYYIIDINDGLSSLTLYDKNDNKISLLNPTGYANSEYYDDKDGGERIEIEAYPNMYSKIDSIELLNKDKSPITIDASDPVVDINNVNIIQGKLDKRLLPDDAQKGVSITIPLKTNVSEESEGVENGKMLSVQYIKIIDDLGFATMIPVNKTLRVVDAITDKEGIRLTINKPAGNIIEQIKYYEIDDNTGEQKEVIKTKEDLLWDISDNTKKATTQEITLKGLIGKVSAVKIYDTDALNAETATETTETTTEETPIVKKALPAEITGPSSLVATKKDVDESIILTISLTQPNYVDSTMSDIKYYSDAYKEITDNVPPYTSEIGLYNEGGGTETFDITNMINVDKIKLINKNGLARVAEVKDETAAGSDFKIKKVVKTNIGANSYYLVQTRRVTDTNLKYRISGVIAYDKDGKSIAINNIELGRILPSASSTKDGLGHSINDKFEIYTKENEEHSNVEGYALIPYREDIASIKLIAQEAGKEDIYNLIRIQSIKQDGYLNVEVVGDCKDELQKVSWYNAVDGKEVSESDIAEDGMYNIDYNDSNYDGNECASYITITDKWGNVIVANGPTVKAEVKHNEKDKKEDFKLDITQNYQEGATIRSITFYDNGINESAEIDKDTQGEGKIKELKGKTIGAKDVHITIKDIDELVNNLNDYFGTNLQQIDKVKVITENGLIGITDVIMDKLRVKNISAEGKNFKLEIVGTDKDKIKKVTMHDALKGEDKTFEGEQIEKHGVYEYSSDNSYYHECVSSVEVTDKDGNAIKIDGPTVETQIVSNAYNEFTLNVTQNYNIGETIKSVRFYDSTGVNYAEINKDTQTDSELIKKLKGSIIGKKEVQIAGIKLEDLVEELYNLDNSAINEIAQVAVIDENGLIGIQEQYRLEVVEMTTNEIIPEEEGEDDTQQEKKITMKLKIKGEEPKIVLKNYEEKVITGISVKPVVPSEGEEDNCKEFEFTVSSKDELYQIEITDKRNNIVKIAAPTIIECEINGNKQELTLKVEVYDDVEVNGYSAEIEKVVLCDINKVEKEEISVNDTSLELEDYLIGSQDIAYIKVLDNRGLVNIQNVGGLLRIEKITPKDGYIEIQINGAKAVPIESVTCSNIEGINLNEGDYNILNEKDVKLIDNDNEIINVPNNVHTVTIKNEEGEEVVIYGPSMNVRYNENHVLEISDIYQQSSGFDGAKISKVYLYDTNNETIKEFTASELNITDDTKVITPTVPVDKNVRYVKLENENGFVHQKELSPTIKTTTSSEQGGDIYYNMELSSDKDGTKITGIIYTQNGTETIITETNGNKNNKVLQSITNNNVKIKKNNDISKVALLTKCANCYKSTEWFNPLIMLKCTIDAEGNAEIEFKDTSKITEIKCDGTKVEHETTENIIKFKMPEKTKQIGVSTNNGVEEVMFSELRVDVTYREDDVDIKIVSVNGGSVEIGAIGIVEGSKEKSTEKVFKQGKEIDEEYNSKYCIDELLNGSNKTTVTREALADCRKITVYNRYGLMSETEVYMPIIHCQDAQIDELDIFYHMELEEPYKSAQIKGIRYMEGKNDSVITEMVNENNNKVLQRVSGKVATLKRNGDISKISLVIQSKDKDTYYYTNWFKPLKYLDGQIENGTDVQMRFNDDDRVDKILYGAYEDGTSITPEKANGIKFSMPANTKQIMINTKYGVEEIMTAKFDVNLTYNEYAVGINIVPLVNDDGAKVSAIAFAKEDGTEEKMLAEDVKTDTKYHRDELIESHKTSVTREKLKGCSKIKVYDDMGLMSEVEILMPTIDKNGVTVNGENIYTLSISENAQSIYKNKIVGIRYKELESGEIKETKVTNDVLKGIGDTYVNVLCDNVEELSIMLKGDNDSINYTDYFKPLHISSITTDDNDIKITLSKEDSYNIKTIAYKSLSNEEKVNEPNSTENEYTIKDVKGKIKEVVITDDKSETVKVVCDYKVETQLKGEDINITITPGEKISKVEGYNAYGEKVREIATNGGVISKEYNDLKEITSIKIYSENGFVCKKELTNVPRIDRNDIKTTTIAGIEEKNIVLKVNGDYTLVGARCVRRGSNEVADLMISSNPNKAMVFQGGIKVVDCAQYSKIAVLVQIGDNIYATDWFETLQIKEKNVNETDGTIDSTVTSREEVTKVKWYGKLTGSTNEEWHDALNLAINQTGNTQTLRSTDNKIDTISKIKVINKIGEEAVISTKKVLSSGRPILQMTPLS